MRTLLLTLVFGASGFIVPAQTLQTLCSFSGTNGAQPQAGLTLGSDGNFYGTTEFGGNTNLNGSYGDGTVFKVTTNGTLTTLVCFNGDNGVGPQAALTLGSDGNFYGTTEYGGSNEWGTVFQVTTNGILTPLVSFNRNNGSFPLSALTLGLDGKLYGTTSEGGNINPDNGYNGYGTVFQVTTNGTLTTLASFNGTNGANPLNGLTLGNDGNFYGTTEFDGNTLDNGYGAVVKLTTNGTLTMLASFNNTNGAHPATSLTLGNDGNFYGTTEGGGNLSLNNGFGFGTIFRVTTNGTLTTLVCFNGDNGVGPQAALTLGSDGNFYGTTLEGGNTNFNSGDGDGTIFRVTTNGTLTTLVSFAGTNGANPWGALTLGKDGNFYGTTRNGGINNSGTVFRLSLSPVVSPPLPVLTLQFWAGYPMLTLHGTLGDTYTVEYTTNLAVSNWTPMLIVPNLPVSPYQMIDPAGIGQPVRFYRAVKQ